MTSVITAKELAPGMRLSWGGTVYHILDVQISLGIVTVYVRERGEKPFRFRYHEPVKVEAAA
jgi:hypothetical protein